MVTMESSLKALIDRGLIGEEDAWSNAFDQREMARLLGRKRHWTAARAPAPLRAPPLAPRSALLAFSCPSPSWG